MKSTLPLCSLGVKRDAQNRESFSSLPLLPRRGGYRTWPSAQRRVTFESLMGQLRKEDGLSCHKARNAAYSLLRKKWLEWLTPAERDAYRADVATSKRLATHEERLAFWRQEATEDGRGA